MQRNLYSRMLEVQERLFADPEHQRFLAEREAVSRNFLAHLETMTREQQEAVMDYLGAVIELHLRTLKFVLEVTQRGESL